MKRTLARNFNSDGRNSIHEHKSKDTFDCIKYKFFHILPFDSELLSQ